jgi:hypothetical protein
MASATITNKTLEIDGMKGDLCVHKVTGALNGVRSVVTQSVTVGEATIEADEAGCSLACAAIKSAGYPAGERTVLDNANISSRSADDATPAQSPGKETTYANSINGAKTGQRQRAVTPSPNRPGRGTEYRDPRETWVMAMKSRKAHKNSLADGNRLAAGVDPAAKAANLVRLRRARGQVDGVERMIKNGRYCADIIIQRPAQAASEGVSQSGHEQRGGCGRRDVSGTGRVGSPDGEVARSVFERTSQWD